MDCRAVELSVTSAASAGVRDGGGGRELGAAGVEEEMGGMVTEKKC